ncbi:nucleotide sugar dehydrogenase [Mycolicibacterium bacteremicum]|nr:nucleotide sugar dehydrogenase [Mycolicibacterium bacteremicum]
MVRTDLLAAEAGEQSHALKAVVAALVGNNESIGSAFRTLDAAGFRVTICGNRISVNDALYVQYTGRSTGDDGSGAGSWLFYGSDDSTARTTPTGDLMTTRSNIESTVMEQVRVGNALRKFSIAVVGMGYVGVPTALSFTDQGAHVVGYDVSESRLTAIKDTRIDLLPRDRPRLVRAVEDELLRLTTEPSAIADTDLVVVCVPTPIDHHLTPDLSALARACDTVVKYARRGQVIVLTSTTYAGCTADLLVQPLQRRGFEVGTDIYVAFSPERIDPGVVDHAPEKTPRVIGGHTRTCSERAAAFLTHTAGALHTVSSPKAAEMTKLIENTFRAVNIALANEFADAASDLEVDIMEVISAASTKPYGYMPFFPGPGVGGHCIPCDPHYLLWQLKAKRTTSPVVDAAMNAISARPRDVVAKAQRVLGENGKPCRGARILVVGVSYKPGLGDVRESPAMAIIDLLAEAGAELFYCDPYVEAVHTSAGETLFHYAEPERQQWDLVVVHTVHPDTDNSWLADQPTVLDATYRLRFPGMHTL